MEASAVARKPDEGEVLAGRSDGRVRLWCDSEMTPANAKHSGGNLTPAFHTHLSSLGSDYSALWRVDLSLHFLTPSHANSQVNQGFLLWADSAILSHVFSFLCPPELSRPHASAPPDYQLPNL